MEPDETAFETLLLRLWPGIREECVGASPDEIQEIEEIAGQPLPSFYRWFLQKMGGDLGPFRFPRLDFRTATILSKYRTWHVSRDPRYLLIAWHSDTKMPNHLFYDLHAAVRGDALVIRGDADAAVLGNRSETLCEMFTHRTMLWYRVNMSECVCWGSFKVEAGALVPLLRPTLDALGFTCPVPTGEFCGVYERQDAALVYSVPPDSQPTRFVVFHLGGASEGLLRQILGTMGLDAGVQVKIDRWFLDNLNP
jgi:hypothetical protein